MYKKQRLLTEQLLFDYYLISSIREDEVFSPFPFYIDRKTFDEIVHSAKVLNNLVRRIINRHISHRISVPFPMGEFPFIKDVLNLSIPLFPFFWVRFDVFVRAGGGIFFTEFNYDKPCAQREILVSHKMHPHGDPNVQFEEKFRSCFRDLARNCGKPPKEITVALLVDPNHYEELHLSYLYCDLLKDEGYKFIIAGAKNFQVEGEDVLVFGEKVDIILRQYPTEFLYEVVDFDKILDLFDRGKVLIINDPRAIIGQAKSLFAYLWELVEKNDPFLSPKEIQIIRDTLPYTRVFHPDMIPEIISKKDELVIKAVYGRYSEEVYIGKMHTDDEWLETIEYVRESDRTHIVQEFCEAKRDVVLKMSEGVFGETYAFGNFGVYLANGEYAGICVRWSDDNLTADETVWFSAIGIREKSLEMRNLAKKNRCEQWDEINERAAFHWGYTGGYTGQWEHFSLYSLLLDGDTATEIQNASKQVLGVFRKAQRLVQDNPDILCPILGISDTLKDLTTQRITNNLTFIGRLDWVFDSIGNLKLLEFNSETPAGLMESIALNSIIGEKLENGLLNPNKDLGKKIEETFSSILMDYIKHKEIRNIGFVTGLYYEDWYNTTIIYDLVKHLDYNFVLGEVSGLEVRDGKLFLYKTPLDAIYRYYPLDWFDSDEYFTGVIPALKFNTLSINPPSTFICQSKTFFALIWELLEQGFYTEEENNIIQKYIPHTVLDPRRLKTDDFCIKPYLGREGQGISFSFSGTRINLEDNCVYQERIDIQSVSLDIFTTISSSQEVAYPIIGSFILGNEPTGFFTRAGGRITDKWAVFLPTFVKQS